jgi:hypothetical protein
MIYVTPAMAKPVRVLKLLQKLGKSICPAFGRERLKPRCRSHS